MRRLKNTRSIQRAIDLPGFLSNNGNLSVCRRKDCPEQPALSYLPKNVLGFAYHGTFFVGGGSSVGAYVVANYIRHLPIFTNHQ